MGAHLIPVGGRKIAFMDLGTNSVRLLVVRINDNGSYTVLLKEKAFARLGEGAFQQGRLQEEAMARALSICGRFRDLALAYGVDEIHAVATSATRDAENRSEFLGRLAGAGLDVKVVSGKEEARLIYLGVAGGTLVGDEKAFFLDIGGGSTEVIVGDQNGYDYLDSLKVGAIRLSNLFFRPEEKGPVPEGRYALLVHYVRNAGLRTIQRLKGRGFSRTLASSGTLLNLAEMASRMTGSPHLSLSDLRLLRKRLCSLDLKERRLLPGMNPERADIIVAGAAIAETLMGELSLPPLEPSSRGLQDGLLLDCLHRIWPEMIQGLSVRERSVLQLCRACGFDEAHGRHVRDLALSLFDEARQGGLHRLGDGERDLLGYAALMHDLGLFLSFSNHHAHSDYIVRNAELLGFDEREIALMAATAFFHRKKAPSKKYLPFAQMDRTSRRTVRVLSLFLRMAESLDRSHCRAVESVELVEGKGKNLRLVLHARRDCDLEILQLKGHGGDFSAVLGRPFQIETVREEAARGEGGSEVA